MLIIQLIYSAILYAVSGLIMLLVLLLLVRLGLNYADVNPFNRSVLTVRRLTDPYVNPVRRALLNFGFGPNAAPLVTVLLAILAGWFAVRLAASVLDMVAGIILSAQQTAPAALLGYILYGLLAVYSLLIFIRIICSWGMVSYVNPLMRWLVRATDPLLLPLRRLVPPVANFDLSPLVAFLLIWIFQAAIAGTLLSGWPVRFVG